jgi:outer membrane protein TolC
MKPCRLPSLDVFCVAVLLAAGYGVRPARADIALTSDEVAVRTQSTSAALATRRAEVEAAEAAVSEARITLWPRLAASGFYARYSPLSAPTLGNVVVAQSPGPVGADNPSVAAPLRFPVLLNSIGVQLGLTVSASDYVFRFPHTIAASERARAAAQAQGAAAERNTWHDGRSLYYAWARAVLDKEVADVAVDQARAHLDFARSRQGAGTGLSTEVIRFESQLASAELLQHKLANLMELLADQLRTSMHDSREDRYVIGETLDRSNDDSAPIEFKACYQSALSHRAELTSLLASMESEKEQAKATGALMYPRLEIYGIGLASNPNPRYIPMEDKFHITWEVGARLSYSPNELAIGLSQSRQHKARAEGLDAQRQQMMEAIRDEVLAAVQARQESALALGAAKKSLALAEDSLRVRRSLVTEGRANHVDVIDAETELVRARFVEVDAKIDAQFASIRLLRSMGMAK